MAGLTLSGCRLLIALQGQCIELDDEALCIGDTAYAANSDTRLALPAGGTEAEGSCSSAVVNQASSC